MSHLAGESQPHLVAIGSVMSTTTALSQVWGTGVMHPDFGTGGALAQNIHALRGRLTHEVMRQGGVMVGDVPLGDPGYLAPSLLGIAQAVTPTFRVGLVCHYTDRHHPVLRRMMQEAGVVDLDVHAPPEVFLRRMAECETVISSSLHGLVFAEALRIPNLWIQAGHEIAGDGFKFRDWFTTTRRPQAAPHQIESGDTAEALAARTERRESTIDVAALTQSFPHRHLDEMARPAGRRTLSISQCRNHPLPVFLISFNRGEMLERAVAAIRGLSTPTEIVVHDNGSTSPSTLAVLDELERDGVKVFRRPPIDSADDLNRVDETVQGYFSDWDEPGRYAVSDCDVEMPTADPRALEVYDELLNTFRQAECVGPMLRIRDIPSYYPLFNRVMNRHIEQFWRHLPTMTSTSLGEVAVLPAIIDTTFALHRAGEAFRRLKHGLRVYEPFEARHLDWYLATGDDEDRAYAQSSSPAVSHWNNEHERIRYRDASLEYTGFHAVRRTKTGALEVYEEQVGGSSGCAPQPPIDCMERQKAQPTAPLINGAG
ncbi:MAG TPA: polysaccharide pyruvyl transferase family protein [Vicinamibacterales bacterium]|nr:polysaccharide pyruvyl transferase family protein [Vicinamibacterales bacterium]